MAVLDEHEVDSPLSLNHQAESWGECIAANLQQIASSILDHGDNFNNAEKFRVQNAMNMMRGVEGRFQDRKNIV